MEVLERCPNVAPGWRGIFATDHGHEPFNDGFMSELLGSLKKHDFRKGADWSDQRCRPASPFNLRSPTIPSCMRLMVLVISRLVIRERSEMVIRYQSLAKTGSDRFIQSPRRRAQAMSEGLRAFVCFGPIRWMT